jgi:hypothetical protein
MATSARSRAPHRGVDDELDRQPGVGELFGGDQALPPGPRFEHAHGLEGLAVVAGDQARGGGLAVAVRHRHVDALQQAGAVASHALPGPQCIVHEALRAGLDDLGPVIEPRQHVANAVLQGDGGRARGDQPLAGLAQLVGVGALAGQPPQSRGGVSGDLGRASDVHRLDVAGGLFDRGGLAFGHAPRFARHPV